MLTTALQLVEGYIKKCQDRGMEIPEIIISLRTSPLPNELTREAIDEDIDDTKLYRAAQLLATGYLIDMTRQRHRINENII